MYRKIPMAPILLLTALFFLLYYPVFTTDYFFSDDIHQLWYNKYASSYTMSATQGRWISGLIFEKLFGFIHTISELKYLRIFSFAGWVLTAFLWHVIFTKWIRRLTLDRRLILLMNVFIVCCIPTAIFIGWVSCMQMFIGIGAGLLSGHLLFSLLIKPGNDFKSSVLYAVFSLAAGLTALFTYQHSFGIFLLPFFIYYLKRQKIKPNKILITGFISYAVILIVYFLLFKYYLSLNEVSQNERVKFSKDIARKLSFLFSDPLPMAFSVNLLYSARSIFSQIIAPVMMGAWAITTFIRFKKRRLYEPFLHIITVLIFLILIYLPSMVVYENFASYRTLFVFNLAVFYLLIEQLLFFYKKENRKKIAIYAICIFLIISGYYNFNFQFVKPLQAEYKAFSGFMKKNNLAGLQTVYFVRADQYMFSLFFHTRPYKDEFGLPSTNKDWVAVPLVKQYILESTGSRTIAEKIKVIQFADSTEFNHANIKLLPGDLLIDMNKLFSDYILQEK